MKKFILLLLIVSSTQLYAQSNCLLILEKNNKDVITYTVGKNISMETVYHQWLDGYITAMRNDSIFVNGMPFHYKEIAALRLDRKMHSKGVGTWMMIAGGGVLFLGAFNGLYRGDNPSTWYTATSYITAGTLLAIGYLLTIKPYKYYVIGEKNKLQFITLDLNKKQSP